MGYVLLWIESLAVSLLLVATLAACIARLRRRWLRWVFLAPVVLIPLAICWLPTIAAVVSVNPFMNLIAGLADAPAAFWSMRLLLRFYSLLALTLLCTIGMVWILRAGRRRKADVLPAAAGWPRGKLAVALGVTVALQLMTYWNLDLAVRQRLAALRAETGALALSVAPVRVPDRDNAAILYEQAVGTENVDGCMRSNNSWPEAWQKKWDEWTDIEKGTLDPQDPDLEAFLRKQAPTLALLREAAEKPGCYFDRDYARPSFDMLLPEVGGLREAARLLAIDARVQAAKGNMRGALENVNAMFDSAGHAASDPILVCLLVAAAIDGMAAETLQAVLASGQATAEDFEALTIDPNFSFRRHFHRAVRMEEAFGLSVLCRMGEGQDDASLFDRPTVPEPARSLFRVFFLNSELPEYQRAMKRCTQWAARPYYKAKSCWDDLDEELRRERRGVFAALLVPALSASAKAAARGDAVRQNVQLAAAMAKYRAEHGRYAETLDDLVPEFMPAVPTDPFDGKPMRLVQTESGPVVYSIAEDTKDDGGTPFDQKKRTGDFVFQLPK